MPRAFKLLWCLIAGLGLLWTGVTASPPAADDAALREVSLQMQWKHCFQYAGYYAAIEKGYYREAGISLRLREYELGTLHWEPVLSGECVFGEMNSSLGALAAKGEPVVLLAPIAQHSGARLAARMDHGIDNVHDLHGKRIMAWENSIDTLAYLSAEGLPPGSYERIPHSYDPMDLIRGDVDAMMVYPMSEGFLFEQKEVPLIYFNPQAGGIDFYGICLYTTRGFLKKNPELVRNFRRATLRGYDYALRPENLTEMIELIRSKYAPDLSEAFLRHQARFFRKDVQPDYVAIGHVNKGRWRHILSILSEAGAAPPDSRLPEGFFYDPHPKPDYSAYIRFAVISASGAVIAFLIAVPAVFLNRRLRRQIQATREAEEDTRAANRQLGLLLKERDQALATISHDLRKPLLSLQMFLDLLGRGRVNLQQNDGQELLSSMRRGSRNLFRRLDNLLEWIKAQKAASAPCDLPFEEVDLHLVFSEVAELNALPIEDKKIAVRADIPESLRAHCYEPHLQTILVNLLENAVKFSPQGGAIRCCASQTENGQYVRLRIRDQGRGFSREELSIWNQRGKIPATINRQPSEVGNGLGLELCCELSKMLDGHLSLANHPLGGAEVTLLLPRASSRSGIREETAESLQG